MTHILLVEDDHDLATMLAEYLVQDGFSVESVHDGLSGVDRALSGEFSMVVLDVMLPQLNGIEALRRIRANSNLPVLMLTARGDDTDRIVGLELGADDYVAKPCTPRELAARVRAILRRTQRSDTHIPEAPLKVGALVIYPDKRSMEWRGEPISLTSTEFNLLEILARNAGKTVSKAVLSEQGMGRELARFDRSIDVHLSSIRHKLGALPDGRSHIQTVYRQGYQFVRED